jgi:glycosyltransferase involved in cell wall biosynthesis
MASSTAALVSILIRSMDRATLLRALDSAAAQTWSNLEIVVVAACGRAHRALPETYRGRLLRLVVADHGGPLSRPDAANAGLDAARGEWVNFLDDDDELLPAHVTSLITAPRADNERIVYSRTRVVDGNGKMLGHCGLPGNHVQLWFHSRSTTCGTLIQRSLIDEGARFDPAFAVYEDHDFFVNCATRTAFRYIDIPTCIWNAQAGESGCGFGSNDNKPQRDDYIARIRRKWVAFFDPWLHNFDAVLYCGQHYLKVGDFAVALDCLERALALRPDDINALNLAGMANYRNGNLERAELLLTHALQRLPQHPGLIGNLALVQGQRGAARNAEGAINPPPADAP